MSRLRSHRRSAAWLALVAMWLAAFAPTVSHALAASGAARWAEVCTERGARLVPVAVDVGTPSDEAPVRLLGQIDHCPYCASGAADTPLAAASIEPVRRDPQGRAPNGRLALAHCPSRPWRDAQPRAPPRLS